MPASTSARPADRIDSAPLLHQVASRQPASTGHRPCHKGVLAWPKYTIMVISEHSDRQPAGQAHLLHPLSASKTSPTPGRKPASDSTGRHHLAARVRDIRRRTAPCDVSHAADSSGQTRVLSPARNVSADRHHDGCPARTELRDLEAAAQTEHVPEGRPYSATCLDLPWSRWFCDPLALSRAGSLANRLPSPPFAGCSGSRTACGPPLLAPARKWLNRGLLCRKLHCPPRQMS